MGHKIQRVFLFLVLSQAAHSIEEYSTKLYDVFPLTHYISGLVSDDHAFGFAILNTLIVAVGLFCWSVPVRLEWRSASALIWFWSVLEACNAIAHVSIAIQRRGYFPGLGTAPLLFLFSVWLMVLMSRPAITKPEEFPLST